MTDKMKMPEVGKRYRCEEQDCDWLEFKDFALRTNIVHNIVYCKFQRHFKEYEDHKYGSGGGYVNYTLGYFLKNFEELPDEPKEDQPTVKENLTDDKQEKREEQTLSIEDAVYDLKYEIEYLQRSDDLKVVTHHILERMLQLKLANLMDKAQNLVNALDDSNIPQKADYDDGIWYAAPDKPGTPEFNKWYKETFKKCPITGNVIQEELPKSIWKPIGQKYKSLYQEYSERNAGIIVKTKSSILLGYFNLGHTWSDSAIRNLSENYPIADAQEYCTFNDFINDYEHLKERIKKLEENNV